MFKGKKGKQSSSSRRASSTASARAKRGQTTHLASIGSIPRSSHTTGHNYNHGNSHSRVITASGGAHRRSMSSSSSSSTSSSSATLTKRKLKATSAPLRGTRDYFPDTTHIHRHVQGAFETVLQRYGYNNEIRTPIIENIEVFSSTLGDDSDVVMKQMYSFDDFGTMTILRPENTASTVRALVRRGPHTPETSYPDHLFYCGPMFRREKPQHGRLRQFYQFGVESVGSVHPYEDVQIISVASDCLNAIGLDRSKITLAINSIGTVQERANYAEDLYQYLKPYRSLLSDDSRRRFDQRFVLRILDSSDPCDLFLIRGPQFCPADVQALVEDRRLKAVQEMKARDQLQNGITLDTVHDQDHAQDDMGDHKQRASSALPHDDDDDDGLADAVWPPQGAPLLRHALSDDSLARFNAVLSGLSALKIPYVVDDYLLRGLDYYCHTTFEFLANMDDITQQQQEQRQEQSTQGGTSNKDSRFKPLTKQDPQRSLPFSSYQAVLAGGRYASIASRFDKFKDTSLALQPLNSGIGWASGLERIVLQLERYDLIKSIPCPKIADIVIVNMGNKRTLTSSNHQQLHTSLLETESSLLPTTSDNPGNKHPLQDVFLPRDIVDAMSQQIDAYDKHKALKQSAEAGAIDKSQVPPLSLPFTAEQTEAASLQASLLTAQHLRSAGLSVLYQPHLSYRQQLGAVYNARFALIIGESEIAKDSVVAKNLQSRTQKEVRLANLIDWLQEQEQEQGQQ